MADQIYLDSGSKKIIDVLFFFLFLCIYLVIVVVDNVLDQKYVYGDNQNKLDRGYFAFDFGTESNENLLQTFITIYKAKGFFVS